MRSMVRSVIAAGAVLTLAAAPPAASAAAAPPEGAYWRTRIIMEWSNSHRFGTKAHPYRLSERLVAEKWATPDGRFWSGSRHLGARQAGPADEKAWRRDGSPATWNKTIDGKTVKLSAKPAHGHVTPERERNQFSLAGQRLTYDEVQRLPADPRRLKDWLSQAGRVRKIAENQMNSWVQGNLEKLLFDLPVPKEVRAGAYRLLLTLPGARAAGQAKDALGRTGAAVVITWAEGESSGTQRFIIDTGRMVPLSFENIRKDGAGPADRTTTTLVEAGWTDTPPAVPALP
ncbi:CU044_5270 family protein [Nonomuraea sp. N2-4H]|uniref:CU044_5270 family protein n=1 Tax=Nonomuraea sp. N2-4H TaxID=3128898 RepID=UPI0032478E63